MGQYLHSHILVKCLMFTTCCIWSGWLMSVCYKDSGSIACILLVYFLYMLSMLCNVHAVQVVVVHVANVVVAQALDVARAKAWHQRRRLIPSRLPLEATLRNCSAQRIDQSKCFLIYVM